MFLEWHVNIPVIWRFLLSSCELTIIFCTRKHFSNYAKNISRHHIKISRLSDQSHGIWESLEYAPGIMPYFALDFSKSKIECRRVCLLHFRRFAFLKSGKIGLTDLVTYWFIDVDREFATAKRKTRQCTSYLERKPTFQREPGTSSSVHKYRMEL